VALGAFGLFLAVDEGFELVVALFADVFVDRHFELRCGLKPEWSRSLQSVRKGPLFHGYSHNLY